MFFTIALVTKSVYRRYKYTLKLIVMRERYNMNQEASPFPQSEQQSHAQQSLGQTHWNHQAPYDFSTLPTSPVPSYQNQRPYQPGDPRIQSSSPSYMLPNQAPKRPSSHRLSIKKAILYAGIVVILLGILGGLLYQKNGLHQQNTSPRPSFPPIGTKINTFTRLNGATLPSYMSWSQDGTQLFTVTMTGDLQIWNTSTWKYSLSYSIPYSMFMAAAWSPNQMYLATANLMDSDQSAVRIWNVATGNEVLAYHGHSSMVNSIAWSPDGTRIVSGAGDRTVQIWDVSTGNTLFTLHTDSEAVAWSPDGKYIASDDSEMVQIWDASTGKTLRTFHHDIKDVWRLSWSPNSKYIALASSSASTIQIWDTTNGHQLLTYHGHSGAVFCIAWSPDGTRIASGGDDQTVQIWNVATGKQIFTYHGHTQKIGHLIWSPDGHFIASSAYDGTLQIWWAI